MIDGGKRRAPWFVAILSFALVACDSMQPDNAGELGSDAGAADGATDVGQDADAGPPLPSRPVEQVALGVGFGCAVAEGELWCWGEMAQTRSLPESPENAVEPMFMGIEDVVDVSVDSSESVCAATSAGAVWCTPGLSNALLGIAPDIDRNRFGEVVLDGVATRVANSNAHACVVTDSSEVWCWGWDGSGEVRGIAATGEILPPTLVHSDAVDVAVGWGHSCSLDTEGLVRCWGSNSLGELGQGDQQNHIQPVVPLPLPAVELSSSLWGICALDTAGDVFCWGANFAGHLGGPDDTLLLSPLRVPFGGPVVQVSLGPVNLCAVLESGDIECLGTNVTGVLQSDDVRSTVPLVVDGLPATTAVAVGMTGCALDTEGTLRCWGDNRNGAAGTGREPLRSTPFEVPLPSAATALATGERNSCALTADGPFCWGANANGVLGFSPDSYEAQHALEPVGLSNTGSLNVVELALGTDSFCGRDGGAVWCWGDGRDGQLGTEIESSLQPVRVPGITTASQLAAGREFACAAIEEGAMFCWGKNTRNQVGLGALTASEGVTEVEFRGDSFGIAAAGAKACGLSDRVWCWGLLWPGFIALDSMGPDLDEPVAMAAGTSHACALDVNGAVTCWGDNRRGAAAAGDPDPDPHTGDPITALGEPVSEGATAVSAGEAHSCALVEGVVWCWGANHLGQAGQGFTSAVEAPAAVLLDEVVVELSSAGNHNCARTESGRVFCWGSDNSGQIGDGEAPFRVAPARVRIP